MAETIHIFLSGSFHELEGAGYGFLVLDGDQKTLLHQEGEPVYNRYLQSSTCAELIGALRAVKWAEKRGYARINLYYNFAGVHGLAHRDPLTRVPELHLIYREFFKSRLGHLKHAPTRVFFHKTGACSPVFVQVADKLAVTGRKKALKRSWWNLLKRQLSLVTFSEVLFARALRT